MAYSSPDTRYDKAYLATRVLALSWTPLHLRNSIKVCFEQCPTSDCAWGAIDALTDLMRESGCKLDR